MLVPILLAALAALLLALSLALSVWMTRRQKLAQTHTPAEVGLPFEEVTFPATDGLKLCGWWIPASGSDRAVIILHGHGGSMDWDVHRAPALHAAGLGVLLFDFRAHGRSPGQIITFGYLERRDVVGAVDWLRRRGVRRVGLLGFSLGGIAAMLAAAICPGVAAVVTDGGPARPRTALAAWGAERGVSRRLSAALAWLAIAGASLRLRANLFRYEPIRWVGRRTCPILFIHGDQDQYVPDIDALYAAALPPKELWRVPGAGHTTVDNVCPDEHRRRVLDFYERHL